MDKQMKTLPPSFLSGPGPLDFCQPKRMLPTPGDRSEPGSASLPCPAATGRTKCRAGVQGGDSGLRRALPGSPWDSHMQSPQARPYMTAS